tara:strand:+ start:722 stop:1093 length:372 start_codon:yes stop_codon:yes gene_type:complete
VDAALCVWQFKPKVGEVRLRFLLRFISLLFLVVAVITGVVDAIQTVAADKLTLTVLGEAWYAFSPDSLDATQSFIQRSIHPLLWDPVIQWVLLQPAVAVFLTLSLVFYLLGYKRLKPAGRFAA